jgi:hydrogenase expression/formation protein HypE
MEEFNLTCPIPIQQYPQVLLAHGGGGKLMHQLIEQMFVPVFGEPEQGLHDAAALNFASGKLAFTTDAYVVQPLFFPGGDIGSLAINGTVNDLAMAGAEPLYLSVSFILEEGLPMVDLWRIVRSMQQAAQRAKVKIVTGDTKVVERGKGDGIFINTAGIGIREHDLTIAPRSLQVGDVVLLNGELGQHGMAIMALREGLEFETTIHSDTMPLAALVQELLTAGIEIHMLRDLTRGGLASALNEIAVAAKMGIAIDENQIPIPEQVRGACEILGLDPLYVANEGKFIAFVPAQQVELALQIMRSHHPLACAIGEVVDSANGTVMLKSKIGVARIMDMLSGEQLPRIC